MWIVLPVMLLYLTTLSKHLVKCLLLPDAPAWRCVYCPSALSSEQELQQHVSSEHVNLQGSVFACAVCSLSFLSDAEFQQHFLSNHVQLLQEEGLQGHVSTPQMVTPPTSTGQVYDGVQSYKVFNCWNINRKKNHTLNILTLIADVGFYK